MTSINFKVFGLTRPEFESVGSGVEPAIFRFPDLPGWEAAALLIWPNRLALYRGESIYLGGLAGGAASCSQGSTVGDARIAVIPSETFKRASKSILHGIESAGMSQDVKG